MALIPQNLITALPFWDAKGKQSFRQHYCQGAEELGAIQCRYDRMLPWTIMGHASAPTYVYLVAKNGLWALDITSLLTMLTDSATGTDYTYHEGALDINQASSVTEYGWVSGAWSAKGSKTWASFVDECQYYYLEISFAGTLYFSELMYITDFTELATDTDVSSNRCRLEVISTCAVGDFPASLAPNKLFLKSPAADPEYSTTKDVQPDGNDEDIDLWVRMDKRYKVTFYAVETVADFIATVPLYSTINFTDQYGFQGPVKDFTYQITWPEDQKGCLALVEITFTREYIAQTGCC